MHYPELRRIAQVLSLVTFSGSLILAPLPGNGQGPGSAAPPSANLPDAIILVQPEGNTDASVAVTYSRTVPHSVAKQSLARLARLAGWKLGTTSVKDQELFDYTDRGARRSIGRQTGIEATATNVVLTKGTAFHLQPFVQAYRNLDKFDIFFMMGGLAEFTGIRSFDHPAVSVTLVQDRGPYRYGVQVKSRSGALPEIPLEQPPPAVQPSATVQGTTEQRSLSFGPILIIAGCAGILAFASLRLLTALHKRGRSGPAYRSYKSGRPLPSGHHIVSRRKD